MQKIQMSKDSLLEAIRKNRETHVQEYNDALEGFMEDLEAEYRSRVEQVQKGEVPNGYISLQKPESHESDYDQVIQMLEMTSANEVEITYEEFKNYVRDEWDWKGRFSDSYRTYNKK